MSRFMKTLTPWFGPHTKPVHIGVYVTRFDGDIKGYSYWDGCNWTNQYYSLGDFAGARMKKRFFGAIQDKCWRGLADKP